MGDPSGTRLAPRCIWIEPEVREWLAIRIEKGNGAERTLCRLLAAKYDAAPADPAEAIAATIWTWVGEARPERIQCANAVLAALGVPANPANEEHQ